MGRLHVHICHYKSPDKTSIYKRDKKWCLFLFNRAEYYGSEVKLKSRIAEINRELSDHCQTLSEISGELYMEFARERMRMMDRKFKSLNMDFTEFHTAINSVYYRSSYPEGGFLAFLIIHNALDILYGICDLFNKVNSDTHSRYASRVIRKKLDFVKHQIEELNGPEEIDSQF